MKIAALYGGDSPEHNVSIRSGTYVAHALENAGYETVLVDPSGLSEDELAGKLQGCDMVLPILHGVNGEDGVVQKMLENINIPYLGSDSKASQIAFDKHRVHDLLEKNGVRMPKSNVVSSQDLYDPLFQTPFVLKPIEGGSSLDTIIARNPTDVLMDQARDLLQKYDKMLLEELIQGQEITVGILGDRALSPIAIIPPENGEFDYENKYNGKTQEIVPIPDDLVSSETQELAKELALRVHNLVNARHISRVDMFVTPEDELVVLELNTIPGMTDQSLLPKSAAADGLDMVSLVKEFVRLVESDG